MQHKQSICIGSFYLQDSLRKMVVSDGQVQ